jgi:hypothetical protein
LRCQPFPVQAKKLRLPVSAAMASATAVETAATVTFATTVEATTATDCASSIEAIAAVKFVTAAESATESIVTVESAMIPIAAAAIKTMSIITTAVEAMEPRAGADEYSVHEVIRSPISVGRASVWGVRIVAVSAYRREPHVTGTNSNADSHAHLRARNGAHRERQNSNNHSIFKITHLRPPGWLAPSRSDFASSPDLAFEALHASQEEQGGCQTAGLG